MTGVFGWDGGYLWRLACEIKLQFPLAGQAQIVIGNAHVSAACSVVRKARTVRGAFPSLWLFTKTYAARCSPTAFFTSSTVSRRISGSSSTILVYGSARFFAA